MATPFDSLSPFAFAGNKFPFKNYKVMGGIRKHVFEYPHAPGGSAEKLGRKLYEFHVSCNFTAGLLKLYPDLWTTLKTLRRLFENQTTDVLSVPHIGEIRCYCDSWNEEVTGKDRSTISVDMVFTEDSNDKFAFDNLVQTTAAAMSDQLIAFQNQYFAVQADLSQNSQNIFSAINDVCSSVLSVKDQIDLYGSLVVSKIQSATAYISDADQQVKELNNPDFWPLLNALHDLWFSCEQLNQDVQSTTGFLRTYTLPISMSISQVSSAIFGDTSHAVELMQLNPIDDPLLIPIGTEIKFYGLPNSVGQVTTQKG